MSLPITNVAIDCAEPRTLAAFWSAATGYEPHVVEDDFALLNGPAGSVSLMFNRVPEAKNGKNRVHIDLDAVNLEEEIARLIGLGARKLDEHRWEETRWVVMADPEGNEFCVAAHG